jgi:cell division protein FtsW (lipid II flippase)
MPWDSLVSFIQAQAPSLEVIATFVVLAGIILVMPRLAGIRWSYWIVARDISLLAFFAIAALVMLRMEPEHHWMQRSANWLQNLF